MDQRLSRAASVAPSRTVRSRPADSCPGPGAPAAARGARPGSAAQLTWAAALAVSLVDSRVALAQSATASAGPTPSVLAARAPTVAEPRLASQAVPRLSAPPRAPDGWELEPLPPPRRRRAMLGAQLDLGVPDGLMASALVAPTNALRASAGLGYNGAGPGLRLGLTVLPFTRWVTISALYGHYFEGDARFLADDNSADRQLLARVGYDFVTVRAGLELGSETFAGFFALGPTYLRSRIHNVQDVVQPDRLQSTSTEVVVAEAPILRVWFPSAAVGFRVML